MLRELDHVQIAMPAGQEAEARRFYGAVLGLREIEKPDNLKPRGGVWFALGSRQIHLGVESDFLPARKAHPAFLTDDLKHVCQSLESAGFAVREEEPLPGFDRIYTDDPFGNRIEILKQK